MFPPIEKEKKKKTHWEKNVASCNETEINIFSPFTHEKKKIGETYARGRITAHEPDGTCHCGGTSGVLSTAIQMRVTKHKRKATQNRLRSGGLR